MPRKGTRLITVNGVQYRWLIRRRPTYSQAICETPLTVAVELADRPASVAALVLPHAHPSNWMGAPAISICPATVAHGIRTALAQGWRIHYQGAQKMCIFEQPASIGRLGQDDVRTNLASLFVQGSERTEYMNTTLEKNFALFARRISLSQREFSEALNHADEICQFLSLIVSVQERRITGSMAHATAIRKFSDVDVLIVLDPSQFPEMTPQSATERIFTALKPKYSQARISENAVRISFTQGPDVDALPALPDITKASKETIYKIPSPDRIRWNAYDPEERDREIHQRDALHGEKFMQLIQAVKWWNQRNGRPIASYEIENIASTAFAYQMPSITYAVGAFFEIAALASAERSGSHVASIANARAIAHRALESEQQDNTHEALDHWRNLLGDQFPSIAP